MIIGNAKDLIDRESQLQTCTGSLLLVRAVEQTVSQLAMQHSIGLCPILFLLIFILGYHFSSSRHLPDYYIM